MKRHKLCFVILLVFGLCLSTQTAFAEDHDDHDVVVGLTEQQITLVEDHALEHIELTLNHVLGIYYGGEACWIPADGDLHIMEPYGDGTVPSGHYQLELVVVDKPASVIAFDSESFQEILNRSNYALDEWNWEAEEGWHFHNHISWGLDPALVTVGQTVTVDLQLIDSTGQYAGSDIFTVSLTAVPEPASLGLLALGAALLRRKTNPKRI